MLPYLLLDHPLSCHVALPFLIVLVISCCLKSCRSQRNERFIDWNDHRHNAFTKNFLKFYFENLLRVWS